MAFVDIDLGVKGVKAFYTTRTGGFSDAPYDALNFAKHVADDKKQVAQNRALISQHCQNAKTAWPKQVHGSSVCDFERVYQKPDQIAADAVVTTQAQAICLVQTADCLAILLASQDASKVAAIHAGWRGLLAGVIENTLDYFNKPSIAYIGAGICQKCFEVGEEVRDLFIAKAPNYTKAFIASKRAQHYQFDYKLVAREILKKHNIEILDSQLCTCCDTSAFFSYRKEGETGRQITAIMKV
ncbi:peptidoglycan editing factor PgeF [Fangia hongkongensis]|uniref:peptidoglycan editing factor PgeF n=1 Tax=Fangia hongkongensis TaxID=270495 RepID=UPI000364F9E5|nr:peptidoglycan editing factor PgeF [Fangia hongkongensis]MBK2124313.1 peptidoglycan editing factor PgeF [Fangia hongkongensis]